jgi:hypothetical protein
VRPLTSTLTAAEVAALLDLTPAAVEALLDSGRVLCHVKGGQPRIPLAQLEQFFRDALIRVYQAEGNPPLEEKPPAIEEPTPEPEEPPREEPPATSNQPPATTRGSERKELPDQRRALRYVPRRQIDGIFEDTKFTILQISTTGLRIRHREPLMPGSEAKVSFALIKPARSIVLRARVVWTSLARSGEERFSISGLRVIEHAERLARAVDSLLMTHDLQPERRVRDRRSDDALTTMLSGATDEEIALVTAAIQKFANDPSEASRWYARARFALSDEQVRRTAPPKPRDREEVLGIWEYLERQVDLEKVAGVVAWTRAAN